MAILLPDKFLYLEHPRTASTATREMLFGCGGLELAPQHYAPKTPVTEPVVSVVRDVYDVLASWMIAVRWRDAPVRFVTSYKHWNDKYRRGGRLFYFAEQSKYLIHYKHLQRGWDDLMLRVGATPRMIPMMNRTDGLKHIWSLRERVVIHRLFREDIEIEQQVLDDSA